MFSDEQIEYMQGLGLNFDFSNLSDDEWIAIEDTVGDRLVYAGLDKDYNPNQEGVMCESILDMLP